MCDGLICVWTIVALFVDMIKDAWILLTLCVWMLSFEWKHLFFLVDGKGHLGSPDVKLLRPC